MIRKDMNDAVYTTEKGKYAAVVDEVVKRHETGQPVLVGTVSVEKSELLSQHAGTPRASSTWCSTPSIHEKEAEIVAQAGKKGAVTIATNMAGRGTDILLGGNAGVHGQAARCSLQGYDDELIEEAIGHSEDVTEEVLEARKVYPGAACTSYKKETDAEHDEVIAAGRPAHHRHRAARVPPHRQPAARPRRPSGRPRLQPVLHLAGGRPDAPVRLRPHRGP